MRPWSGGEAGELVRGDDTGPFVPFEETDENGDRWLTFTSRSSGKSYRSLQLERGAQSVATALDAKVRHDAATLVRQQHQLVTLEMRRAAAERLGFLKLEQEMRDRMSAVKLGHVT